MGIFFNRTRRTSRPAVEVGLYGKLPCTGDFIRLHASNEDFRRFDHWLSGALTTAERLLPDWDIAYHEFSPLSFLFHSDSGSGRCIFGTLAPSSDQIGRRYPLVLFAELDTAAIAADYTALPHHQFLRDLRAVIEQSQHGGRDRVIGMIERIAPPDEQGLRAAAQAHQRFLGETECTAAFASMFGLAHVVQQGRAVAALRSACSGVRDLAALPRYGIRCPLGLPYSGSAAFWLELQRRWTPARVVPHMLWTDQTLMIYFSGLASKALTAAWSSSWRDDALYDLATADGESDDIEARALLRDLVA